MEAVALVVYLYSQLAMCGVAKQTSPLFTLHRDTSAVKSIPDPKIEQQAVPQVLQHPKTVTGKIIAPNPTKQYNCWLLRTNHEKKVPHIQS